MLKRLSENDKLYIKNEYNKGISYGKIAKDLGFDKKSIIYNARKLGIQTRRDRTFVKIGDVFGSLVVIDKVNMTLTNKKGNVFICKCICGNQVKCFQHVLLKQKSCYECRGKTISDTKWSGVGEISKELWTSIQSKAFVRGYEFDLKIEEAWQIFINQNRKCALSGVELFFSPRGKSNRNQRTASLDRIDSSIGYNYNNVQWVHKDVNKIKMNLSQVKFIEWCNLIANFQKDKLCC